MATAVKVKNNTPKNKPIVKMGGKTKLASTIVEQGPRDDLTRVDGYGKKIKPLPTTPNLTLNKYMDDFFQSYTGLADALGLSKINLLNPKGLKTVTDTIKNLVNTVQDYKKRIEDNVLGGRSLESLVDIASDFKHNALEALQKHGTGINIMGLDIGHMVKTGTMVARDAIGVYNMVKNGDWKSLSGIKNALEALGGNDLVRALSPIIDVNAISAFMGTMMSTASRLGLNGIIDRIAGMFTSRSDRNAALDIAMYNAAQRSDMYMMEDILKIIPRDELNSNNPKMIKWILSNYKVDILYTSKEIKTYRNRLLAILAKINPNWYFSYFGNQKVYLLEPLNSASADAKMLLNYEDTSNKAYPSFRDLMMIAPSFQGTDIKRELMMMYTEISFEGMPTDPYQKYND